MKKVITRVLILLFTVGMYAQDGINYKALIKDNLGVVVANETIDVRFTIIADTGSTNVYVETHTGATTDANGIVILTIGDGTSSDTFSDINWGGDTHSLKVEIDIEQDASFVDMGTTQFMSVPYALQATTATTATTATALTGGIDQGYIAALEARIAALEPQPAAIGDFREGGIVFYIYQQGDAGYVPGEVHGLIAATTDQSLGIAWITGGNTQTTINGVTSSAVGTGQANTTAMMNQAGYTGGAAKVCTDYSIDENGVTYDDWFLPSRDELNLMWSNLADSDSDGENTGPTDPNNIGNFETLLYWSSTEYNVNNAWAQNFANGFQIDDTKGITSFVRAVRAF